MPDEEPHDKGRTHKDIVGYARQAGRYLVGGLVAASLAKTPQTVDAKHIPDTFNDSSKSKNTLVIDTSASLQAPESQIDRGQKVLSVIKSEFPDQYQKLSAKGKIAELTSLASSLGNESHDDNEAAIFGRMTGKFLEKNFLNFAEANQGDYTNITPEIVRVERMLLERYKEKIPVYGFEDIVSLAQNPDASQQIYAFQDLFTVLRTYKDEFDPKINNAKNSNGVPDQGEELHTINAIDIVGQLYQKRHTVGRDYGSFGLVYATLAVENVPAIHGIDELIRVSEFITPNTHALEYEYKSHLAIRVGVAAAELLKGFSDEDYRDGALSLDAPGIARATNSLEEARSLAINLAHEYQAIDSISQSQKKPVSAIDSRVRINPSVDIPFNSIPAIVEARKIPDPQLRFRKMIELMPVEVADPERHPRYDYIDNGLEINTCNIRAADLLQALDVPIGHRVDVNGNPSPDGRELDSEGMYSWIQEHGSRFGWQDVTNLSYEDKKKLLSEGYVFFGATPPHNWVVGMLEDRPVVDQASVNMNAMFLSKFNYKINGSAGVIYAHKLP